ncbi:MAG: lysophospholipid acyltransferase family protein [Planctomycetia bacterium]|nr:lysophospholipid acyltransferase family protein [Planctomycetia bacterium]
MKKTGWKAKLTHWLQYLTLRLCAMGLQAFPIDANLITGRIVGSLVYWLDKKHRLRAIGNIRRSFPEFTEDQVCRLAKESSQHLIMLGIEMLCLPRVMSKNTWYHHLEVVNYEETTNLATRHRPTIMVTGHFGNWEMAGYIMATLKLPTHTVARPLDNPYIDKYLAKLRGHTGQQIIIKSGATDAVTEVLRNGHILATVADQDAGRRGFFVDFFGRRASTFKSIALFAIEMNAVIVVGGAYRTGKKFHYLADIVDYIFPEDYERSLDGALAITERYTKSLERLIRKAPGQYLWVHRRWKTRPPDEEGPNLEVH